ncbi:hypothetical protein [Streptomyces sp. NPDC047315]|uniref:hypothetical protein n=1 Tax=Streptomyces sp. NPDC047315 TaxID=3155142 RepID=UPI0033F2D846
MPGESPCEPTGAPGEPADDDAPRCVRPDASHRIRLAVPDPAVVVRLAYLQGAAGNAAVVRHLN